MDFWYITTVSYYPQANGLAEKSVQIIKQLLWWERSLFEFTQASQHMCEQHCIPSTTVYESQTQLSVAYHTRATNSPSDQP